MSGTSHPSKNPPAIWFDAVGLRRKHRDILQGISWQLPAQGVGAILGPNGSGKSTLLRMATGYIWPTSGSVWIGGRQVGSFPVVELRKDVSIVEGTFVEPFYHAMSTLEVVATGLLGKLVVAYDALTPTQWERAARTANMVGLARQLDQPYRTLSTGERMRALLARGMMAKPTLLILDECTNGLDLPGREAFLATVEALCRLPDRPAVLVITHYAEELPACVEQILLLNQRGCVGAQGLPAAVMTSENFSAAYNWPITIRSDGGRYVGEARRADWVASLRGG